MRFYALLFSLLLFSTAATFAQSKTISSFEKAKGALAFPVSNYLEVTKSFYDSSLHFKTDSACAVNSISDGIVSLSKDIPEGGYMVIIKSDDFFLSYVGLTTPLFKKGDSIKAGQQIATVFKYGGYKYELDFFISGPLGYSTPALWFKDRNVIKQLSGGTGVY